LVTGKTRNSNIKYIDAKATRLGIDVDTVIKSYVSRDALKLLRQGKTFEQVRQKLGVAKGFASFTSSINLEELLRINSKGKHS
jgi:phosphotransferase system IIB component